MTLMNENMTLVCDICRERPLVDTVKIKGVWFGVCNECKPGKKELKMKIKAIKEIKTKEEARQTAIDWQTWQSKQSLSYAEVAEWNGFFTTLAEKFNLTEEFKENCII